MAQFFTAGDLRETAKPVYVLDPTTGEIVDFTDIEGGVDTTNARLLRMYDDNYSPVKVYPTMAAGASVTSPAGLWALGAVATVIPAGTVAKDFLIHFLTLETLSVATGTFELVLYRGDGDTEIARVRFSVAGGFFGNSVYRMPSALVPAGSRVRAAMACSAGAATATISLGYREIEP